MHGTPLNGLCLQHAAHHRNFIGLGIITRDEDRALLRRIGEKPSLRLHLRFYCFRVSIFGHRKRNGSGNR